MSGAEAALVLGVISSCITLIDASKQLLDAARDGHGLPEAFRVVESQLPLVMRTLKNVEGRSQEASKEDWAAVEPMLESCKRQAKDLKDVLQKVMTSEKDGRLERYRKHIMAVGKGHKVETLAQQILEQLQHLQANHIFANIATSNDLQAAVTQLQNITPSINDDDDDGTYNSYGSGSINVAKDRSIQNNQTFSGKFESKGSMHFGPGTK